jgi:putative ABC transport system permease protein
MLNNYFNVTYRNLLKYKFYSLINILGLSVGIASVIFIAIFVTTELSYDSYNKNLNRIYRVGVKGKITGEVLNQVVTAAPMAKTILNEVPHVEFVTRIGRFGDWLVQYKGHRFNETDFLFADSSFFNVFTIPFIEGNAETALSKPNSVVITAETAERYFGKDSPLGEKLRIESDSTFYTVTGVVQLPVNTHFQFDFLGSLSSIPFSSNDNWLIHNFYTYVVVKENTSEKELTDNLNKLLPKYVYPLLQQLTGAPSTEFFKSENAFFYFVQPLSKIHLYSNRQLEIAKNGDIKVVYVFIFIAILLLAIASINFMNLTTARSATRSREIALRKVMGSTRSNLVWQFLIESLIFTVAALIVALVIVEIFTPYFQTLIGLQISLHTTITTNFAFFLVLLTLIIGLLAGSYPAWVLASFDPVLTLKQQIRNAVNTGKVRNILVILQFAASVFILICTLAMHRQLDFVLQRKLGFEKENVLVIKRSDGLKANIDSFKNEIRCNPKVLAVANATHVPGKVYWKNAFFHESNPNTTYLFNQSIVTADYDEVLKLKLTQGRFLKKGDLADTSSCLINETAAKMLGLTNPVGTKIFQPIAASRKEYTIIGVLSDFNYQSLHYAIEPMIMTCMQRNMEGYIVVRVSSGDILETISFIRKAWEKYTPDYIFEYSWLDKDFNDLYNSEIRTFSIFSTFAILSIFIACLGLFGLIAFNVSQRTKEIGVRKTFGASFGVILFMILKDTIRLVLLSFIFAWPLAYVIINKWMSDFSYQAGIHFFDFIVAALMAILISIVTISVQAIKASSKNPVDALHYE